MARKKYLDQLFSRLGQAKEVDPDKKCEVKEGATKDRRTMPTLDQPAEFPETDNKCHIVQTGGNIKHGFAAGMERLSQAGLAALEKAKVPKKLVKKDAQTTAINVTTLADKEEPTE